MRPLLNDRAGSGAIAIVLAIALTALLAQGCAGSHRGADPRPSRPAESSVTIVGDGPGIAHTVEKGQTLWRIARVYGLTVSELMQANGLTDPSELETGIRLWVPGARELRHVPPYPAPLPEPGVADAPAAPLTERVDRRREPASTTGSPGFSWPVRDARILSAFGAPRGGRPHKGVDLRGSDDRIRAAAAGRVTFAGNMRGYGKTVIVEHPGGLRTLYAHNADNRVRAGERVERGQWIARVGSSGNATGRHCHFEVQRNGVAVDPLSYLPGVADAAHTGRSR